jgi:hypothetical protein
MMMHSHVVSMFRAQREPRKRMVMIIISQTIGCPTRQPRISTLQDHLPVTNAKDTLVIVLSKE